ncbi:hypothetical protein [Caulobacter endophyticus]|uniref:Uncharacterized protein n=1 Tax=Caulobacter endophyticus TaxID=2172652 RepID=A0A2T9K674_9CAUL|nr:hypothetical protein [Caulobacter endophyticus]PVM91343.1 hypothetical protein DDF67_07630 [Caulobacter endophyticus]
MASTDFHKALEDLYAAFAVARPRDIDGCPCCVDKRNVDVLLSKPLRKLTADDLHGYASGVFLTVGALGDYFYLLPRLLELSAAGPRWILDPQIVVGRLRHAEWEYWSDVRRGAIVRFLDAWFDQALALAASDEGGFDPGG